MLGNVFLKTLRDQRRSLCWWVLGVVALSLFTVLFYPSIADAPEFDEMLENLPEALSRAMLGDVTDLTSPEGYLNSQLFVFMIPLVFLIFTVARGSGAVAGEEERGTLELLLSYPIRRWKLVTDKFSAMASAIAIVAAGTWLSLFIGAAMVDMEIGAWRLAEATFSAAWLSLVFGTFALALGSATGKRNMSIGITAGLAAGAYLLNAMAPLSETLEPTRKFSPFYYYSSSDPLSNGLDPLHVLVMAGLVAVFLVIATLTFERRDIGV
ncbi:MAG: ABC transporter permease subunit [Chloroflexi bacterium]|nr:ABC transporter permease subunit [Chloroflexota bacterium]